MPPPPPPPPLASNPAKNAPKNDRNALLTDIHKGIKLKKTVTNDRSVPLIAGKVGNATTTTINNSNNVNNKLNGNTNSSTNIPKPIIPSGTISNPTEQLNSMFAGGFPKKPSEMRNMLNKPVSSQPVVRPPSPENKKVNLPAPPVIKPKPGGYSNLGTLNKNNGSSVTSLKDEGNNGTLKQRPGGPPPPPPPKKFSGQQFSGYSSIKSSQGIPPPPVPPPIFNKPFPTTISNTPPQQSSSKITNDSGAVSPVRPPPPPPQRLQSIPQVSTNYSSSLNTENTNENTELNNNSKIEKLVEAFYSRFTFTPLHEIPPPPEFKNIPKEYASYRKKVTQH